MNDYPCAYCAYGEKYEPGLRAELDQARAENARLREALKRIATDGADLIINGTPTAGDYIAVSIARAALAGKEPG